MKIIDADKLAEDLTSRGFYPAVVKRAVEDAPAVDRWIPVTERLPEKVGYYIVWDKYAGVPITLFYHDSHDYDFADKYPIRYFGNAANQNRYTHWMPLPEPPEVES